MGFLIWYFIGIVSVIFIIKNEEDFLMRHIPMVMICGLWGPAIAI